MRAVDGTLTHLRVMVEETSVILILNNYIDVHYIFVSEISYFYILWILNQIDDECSSSKMYFDIYDIDEHIIR